MIAGFAAGFAPMALFALGGGGSTTAFLRSMAPLWIVAAALVIAGIVVLVRGGGPRPSDSSGGHVLPLWTGAVAERASASPLVPPRRKP